MSARDVFGIVVRFVGLSLLIFALWYLIYGIATVAGFPEQAKGYKYAYFITGAFFLLASLYLLRGAPLLMRYSYPQQK